MLLDRYKLEEEILESEMKEAYTIDLGETSSSYEDDSEDDEKNIQSNRI